MTNFVDASIIVAAIDYRPTLVTKKHNKARYDKAIECIKHKVKFQYVIRNNNKDNNKLN